LISNIKYDFSRYSNKKGNPFRYLKKILSHHGFRALFFYRIGYYLKKKNFNHLAGFMERLIFHTCYCQISTTAKIGQGLYISHTIGLVIGGETIIGKNCDVRQNVTFGGNFNKIDGNGRTQPLVKDNVSVGAGAVIIGPIIVGSNSIIGANTVVTKDVPENIIYSGNPGKILKKKWSISENRKL